MSVDYNYREKSSVLVEISRMRGKVVEREGKREGRVRATNSLHCVSWKLIKPH